MRNLKENAVSRLIVIIGLFFVFFSFFVPQEAYAATCVKEELKSFEITLPDKDGISNELKGKKVSIYNNPTEGFHVAKMGKAVTIQPIDGDGTAKIDVGTIASVVMQDGKNKECLLSNDKAKQMGYRDGTVGLYEKHEDKFKMIQQAVVEELSFSNAIKMYMKEKINRGEVDFKALGLNSEEEKQIKQSANLPNGLMFVFSVEKLDPHHEGYAITKKFFQNYFKNMSKAEMDEFLTYTSSISKSMTGLTGKGNLFVNDDTQPYAKFTTENDYQNLLTKSKTNDFSKAKQQSYGNVSNSSDGATSGKLIAAPGFITGGYYEVNGLSCEEMVDAAQDFRDENPNSPSKAFEKAANSENSGTDLNTEEIADGESSFSKNAKGGVQDVTDGFAKPHEDGNYDDSTLMGLNCAEFGMVNMLTKLYEPVNITNSQFLMKMIYMFQIVALGVGLLLIAVYALFYATGNETTDPFKFLIRGFVIMFVVAYLPYFMQDILYVNNMLVYFINKSDIGAVDEQAFAGMGLLVILVGMSSVLSNLGLVATLGGFGVLFLLIIFLIVIVFFVKVIITLVVWWFARFLMIMFLAMLGPVFVVMMMLPRTANYGFMWLKSFIGEVMVQSVMVIGMYFVAQVMANMEQINQDFGLTVLGDTILIYCMIHLISKLPEFSQRVFGGSLSGLIGWQEARTAGDSVGGFVRNAGMAAASSIMNNRRQKRAEELYNEANELQPYVSQGIEHAPPDIRARWDNHQKKMEKFNRGLENRKRNEKISQSFGSGRLVDDGRAMETMNKTSENATAITKAASEYKKDRENAQESSIMSRLEKADNNYQLAKQRADEELSQTMADINRKAEMGEIDEEQKASLEQAALQKHQSALERAEKEKERERQLALQGHSNAKEASEALMAKADAKLDKSVKDALGKGQYNSEIEKSLHAAKIAGDIRSKIAQDEAKASSVGGTSTTGASRGPATTVDLNRQASNIGNNISFDAESFGNINPIVTKVQEDFPGVNQTAAQDFINQVRQSKNAEENAILDTAEIIENNALKDGMLDQNGRFADGETPLDKATSIISASNVVQELRNKTNLSPNEKTRLEQAQTTLNAFAESGNFTQTQFEKINQSMKTAFEAKTERMNATSNFMQNSGLETRDAERAKTLMLDSSESNVQDIVSKSQNMPIIKQANNSAYVMPQLTSATEYMNDASAGYQVNGVASDFADIQSKEQLATLRKATYEANQTVNAVGYRIQGMSPQEAVEKANQVMPDYHTYTSGSNVANHMPTNAYSASHVLGMAQGNMMNEVGKHYATNGIDSDLSYSRASAREIEQSYGKTVAKSAFEELKTISASTIASADFSKIGDGSIRKVQHSIDTGGIRYDNTDGRVSGDDVETLIHSVQQDLVQQGMETRHASLVAEQYVRTAASAGTSNVRDQLPIEAQNVIITELLKGEMERDQIIDSMDTLTGHHEGARKMVEAYIQKLETRLGGDWNTIRGDVPMSEIEKMPEVKGEGYQTTDEKSEY